MNMNWFGFPCGDKGRYHQLPQIEREHPECAEEMLTQGAIPTQINRKKDPRLSRIKRVWQAVLKVLSPSSTFEERTAARWQEIRKIQVLLQNTQLPPEDPVIEAPQENVREPGAHENAASSTPPTDLSFAIEVSEDLYTRLQNLRNEQTLDRNNVEKRSLRCQMTAAVTMLVLMFVMLSIPRNNSPDVTIPPLPIKTGTPQPKHKQIKG
jgi:hypothetical protein